MRAYSSSNVKRAQLITRQIRALEAVGVDLLLLNMNFGNMKHAKAMRSLRLFGQEVLPAFR